MITEFTFMFVTSKTLLSSEELVLFLFYDNEQLFIFPCLLCFSGRSDTNLGPYVDFVFVSILFFIKKAKQPGLCVLVGSASTQAPGGHWIDSRSSEHMQGAGVLGSIPNQWSAGGS